MYAPTGEHNPDLEWLSDSEVHMKMNLISVE